MECNKDEALRVKQMAESRMQKGEFVDALRFAKKAKNLYAEVDKIAQIITVCEVHNAAQNYKLSGSDMNWYEILQTERLADESAIKKQYRKLALLLHPDKNKFSGAEVAFKLIGEANSVLSDKAKRSSFDMKFKVSVRTAVPKTSSHHSNGNVFAAKNVGKDTKYQNKSSSNTPAWNDHQHACRSCKYCNDRSFVISNIPNLTCSTCSRPLTPDTFVNIKDPPIPARKSKAGKPPGGKSKYGYVPASKTTKAPTSANTGSKRVRQSAPVSRGSSKAGNSDEKKDSNVPENDVDPSRFNVRRSSRQKQQVSYAENIEDDDFGIPSKKPRQKESFDTNEVEKENVPTTGGSFKDNNPASHTSNFEDSHVQGEKSRENNCFPLNSDVPLSPEIIILS